MSDDEIEVSATVRAYQAVGHKLSLHGSFSKWPTLSLFPNQFRHCRCGRPRHRHKYIGVNLTCSENKSGLFEARGVNRD